MESNPVKRWRVICLAENKLVEIYSPETPTLCPNDHPDRSIDKTRVVLLETLKNDRVEIVDSTSGQFQHTSLHMQIPSGDPDSVSTHDFSWPIDIKIWKTEFIPNTEHVGDHIDVIIDPDRIVGTLRQDANIGDTVLSISSEAFDYPNLARGIEILLDDDINTENAGRLIGYDRDALTMVIENPLTQNFTTGTKFCINTCIVKESYVSHALIPHNIGQKEFSAQYLPANAIMRILWKNNDGQAKDACFMMEYNYQ